MRAVSPRPSGYLLLALVLIGACAPWPPPAPPRETSLGLGISTTTLPNGLRVVIVNDPKATEVQVTTRYQVGAVDDGDQPGMAHLVEHLLFQQVVDGQSVFARLEDVATQFNALTTFDATTYVTRAPQAALDTLLAIEALRLEARCGTLTDAAFVREREVVLNELTEKDQATQILAAVHAALYPEGHPYRRPVGGTVESVGAITRDQACAFADAHYAPGNAALVISGNLSDATIETALDTLRTRISKRAGAAPHPVPSAMQRPQHVDVPAPVDEDLLVLAWPLPLDPELQASVRAIGASLVSLVDSEIKGRVVSLEFGDARAPMLGLAVVPDEAETFQQAIDGTRRGIAGLPKVFDEHEPDDVDLVVFERLKHGAIYRVYAALEDGSDRDLRLASYVLTGRDPRQAIDGELAALEKLTRARGAELAARYLASSTPTVLTLKATPGTKRGDAVALRAPVHDLGPRRTPPDPARAHQPADAAATPAPDGMHTHVLDNGLRVVLLPQATVPTFEARLVFRAGTADEPEHRRGVAMLAAHTLTWDLRHLDDLLAFARAGGMRTTDVSTDRTTFAVQGLDKDLDVVLAGLRRWVLDGTYDDSAHDFVAAIQQVTKRVDDQGQLTDAWRAALFGPRHPYVKAGIARHAHPGLTLAAARDYRSAYFTPDRATLVLAGRFDHALAERWIDYLFAQWEGSAATRVPHTAAPQPASLASVDDIAMVQVRLALPAGTSSSPDRARQLVAAAMLDAIAADVRHQLGASYAFDAQLAETRAASFYSLGGWVDAVRAVEAVQLVRDRIHALRTDPDAAARAFVTARDHALVQLRSYAGTTSALAARVETDVELDREPLSALATAAAVQKLTVDGMQPTLAALDLSRATVLVHGPDAEVKDVFEVLGRTPQYIQRAAPPVEPSTSGPRPAPIGRDEQHVWPSDLEPALTQRPPFPRHVLTLMAGAHWAELLDVPGLDYASRLSGPAFAARIGYRVAWRHAIGIHLGLAKLSNSQADARAGEITEVLPLEVLGVLHSDHTDRLWADLLVGIQFERVTSTTSEWRHVPLLGASAGIDLVRAGTHRIGVGVTMAMSPDHGAISVALVYRQ